MATKMLTLRVDEELLGWATDYAKGRGVSRTSVVEAALRSLREDAAAGVPDLEDERVPRPVPKAPKRKPTPPPSVVPPVKPDVRRLLRSEQSKLAMARMRAMDPRRYG